ncbi:hypothetical protein PF002_g14925 [Phytophthora fragariae]|uniref:Uncharacterized protein n=1 Tax=Phytophthora fragariae TaxID=53985 RepID=A0A6A3TY03_9STRA|nr:hypothetical protein PF003_g10232 [Phytophthora fragariae]KAE8935220.1 hypothetical protein PF009_g14823 [Phytophthora fragariae]KAE9142178.1 hypothetical protein PF006_g12695 [Phytophthora fragariae]KAE9223593.1 hypothetical protein PF002_g14925 [Phytophthora fragariae]KAE9304515.1 hypothetical protein PF001_g13037 [Phytophthora fragariae]
MGSERPLTSMTPGSEDADRNNSSSVDMNSGKASDLASERVAWFAYSSMTSTAGWNSDKAVWIPDADSQALGEPTKDGKHHEVETTATLLMLLISFVVAALVLPLFLLFDSFYRHIKRIDFFT